MNSGIACIVCGEEGHRASRCKSAGLPPDGFYSGGGGGHQHDDDCEETASISHLPPSQIYSKDDESLSKQQETASSHPYSPNKPSNEAV